MNTTVADFVRNASTEISTHDEDLLESLSHALPAGTTLYIAHTPKAKLEDVVRVAVKAQALGFRASPHLAARRIAGEGALRRALEGLRDGGVRQVLLVAGDLQRPVGDFSSTLRILDTGLLESTGIEQVGVGDIPMVTLQSALTRCWQRCATSRTLLCARAFECTSSLNSALTLKRFAPGTSA